MMTLAAGGINRVLPRSLITGGHLLDFAARTLGSPIASHTGNAMSQNSSNVLSDFAAQVNGLRETGRVFWQRGWSVGTSSNYSMVVRRDPLELLITASGKDKGALSQDDFVVVDQHGQPVAEGQPKSSAETLLHVMAAGDPQVGAVLHTHSVWGTLLSDLYFEDGGLQISGYEMLKGLAGVTTHEHSEWVPIFENTQDIPSLADQVQQWMQGTDRPSIHGYLIRRHGLYTWGSDLAEARRHIEIFEFLFECVARRLSLRSAVR